VVTSVAVAHLPTLTLSEEALLLPQLFVAITLISYLPALALEGTPILMLLVPCPLMLHPFGAVQL
jgi:hypothetical protein